MLFAARSQLHFERTNAVKNTSGYTVLADEVLHLGEDDETLYRRLRVQLTSGEEVVLLTSLLNLTADQIYLLYRYRWTIEIVFRCR